MSADLTEYARKEVVVDPAKRITAALTQPVYGMGHVIELRASVGVAWSSAVIDAVALVAQADHAMYESKRKGSSSVVLFTDSDRVT